MMSGISCYSITVTVYSLELDKLIKDMSGISCYSIRVTMYSLELDKLIRDDEWHISI